MLRVLLPAAAFLAFLAPLQAQEPDAKALVKIIAPYINDTTQVVAHANVGKVNLKKYFETVAMLAGDQNKEMEAFRELALMHQKKLLDAGMRDILAVVNIGDLVGQNPPQVIVVAPLGPKAEIDDLLNLLGNIPGLSAKIEKQMLVARFGMEDVAQPKERAEFVQGLEALKDQDIQFVASPSADVRQMAAKLLGAIPSDLGAEDITTLTTGIRWVGIGYDTSKLSQGYMVQAKDVATAKNLKLLADKGLGMLNKLPGAPEEVTKLKEILVVKQQGDRLTMVVDQNALMMMLKPSVIKVRQAAARTQSINNLKQIGLAMLNHEAAYKTLPARAIFDANGKPLLSWRVHVLPFVEELDLYKQFNLKEPWDSEHNKKLIARIPAVFASPQSMAAKEGKTTYLAVTGKNSMFEGIKGLRLVDVTDGLSNTVMVVEVNDSKAVYWTQPEDFPIDTKGPFAALVRKEDKSFAVLFGDISVRTLFATLRPATLAALFTRNGGEVVDVDEK